MVQVELCPNCSLISQCRLSQVLVLLCCVFFCGDQGILSSDDARGLFTAPGLEMCHLFCSRVTSLGLLLPRSNDGIGRMMIVAEREGKVIGVS